MNDRIPSDMLVITCKHKNCCVIKYNNIYKYSSVFKNMISDSDTTDHLKEFDITPALQNIKYNYYNIICDVFTLLDKTLTFIITPSFETKIKYFKEYKTFVHIKSKILKKFMECYDLICDFIGVDEDLYRISYVLSTRKNYLSTRFNKHILNLKNINISR